MLKIKYLSFLCTSVFLLACGGGDDDGKTAADGNVAADASTTTNDATLNDNDASTDPLNDAGNAVCTALADYGAGTLTMQEALAVGDPAEVYFSSGALNADEKFDSLRIDLFRDFGVFTGGEIEVGTFELAGDELNYSTCGVCVLLVTEVAEEGDPESYMATGGTVTITALSPNLQYSVSNLTFTHVTIDEKTLISTPVGDCDSALTSASFDAEVAVEETPPA